MTTGFKVHPQVETTDQLSALDQCFMDRVLQEAGVAVCVKDRQKKEVLFQNSSCVGTCGSKVGQECPSECMKWVKTREVFAEEEGFLLGKSQSVHGSEFDIMVLSNEDRVTCMLYPVGEKHEKEMEFFRSSGLSNRELEIMGMVVRDFTNAQIMETLTISKATLKTHLNNIYKKLPSHARFDIRTRGFKR